MCVCIVMLVCIYAGSSETSGTLVPLILLLLGYLQWQKLSTPFFFLFNTLHHLLFLLPNYSTLTYFSFL